MPDDRDVTVIFQVTESTITVERFEVSETRARGGIEVTEEYQASYTEMLGVPEVSQAALRNLSYRLAERMDMETGDNITRDECLSLSWEALSEARWGNNDKLRDLLVSSMFISPSQLEELCQGPGVNLIDRLSQYLHATISTA